jgi:hypothetical protein
MAGKDSIGKAAEAAKAARRNQYVQRLIEDDDLRQNILAAYAASRSALAASASSRWSLRSSKSALVAGLPLCIRP